MGDGRCVVDVQEERREEEYTGDICEDRRVRGVSRSGEGGGQDGVWNETHADAGP